MTLGNHELHILRGTDIESSIEGAEKEHYKWVKENLTDKELAYISNCPLYYEYTITYDKTIEDYKIAFLHYLFNDINADNPFECTKLNKDINLWIKHNMERKEHIIGHLHSSFNVNDVDGINGDYISSTGELANITVVDSAGCTKGNQTSYLLINIGKSIEKRRVMLEYDRRKFEKKILSTDFPDKQNIFMVLNYKSTHINYNF